MNIFYDFQTFSLQRRGGISRYFVSLWEQFQVSGVVQPELLLGINQTNLDAEIARAVKLVGPRVKDPRLPKTRWITWLINCQLCRHAVSRSCSDIYHPTYYWLPKNIGSKALVLTVYDLMHEIYPHLFQPNDYVFRWRPEAIRRADVILAISETTKNDLCERYKVASERVFVTPLGCSLHSVDELPELPAQSRPSLLYVGERFAYKNFSILVAAWRNSESLRKNYRLVCFGGPPPTPEEAALPGDVKFLRGDDLALANAYRQASALIYPSLYEGFGLPLLEAFQMRCPVVTSGCGSIREVAGNAAEYFEATSAESLINSLNRVLNNSSWRETLLSRGVQRLSEYSWKRCAEATEAAYRVALASRKGETKG
jgi:glycosyltransferase involved in cell wall biosynthesis